MNAFEKALYEKYLKKIEEERIKDERARARGSVASMADLKPKTQPQPEKKEVIKKEEKPAFVKKEEPKEEKKIQSEALPSREDRMKVFGAKKEEPKPAFVRKTTNTNDKPNPFKKEAVKEEVKPNPFKKEEPPKVQAPVKEE